MSKPPTLAEALIEAHDRADAHADAAIALAEHISVCGLGVGLCAECRKFDRSAAQAHASQTSAIDFVVKMARLEQAELDIELLEAPGRHTTAWDGTFTDTVMGNLIQQLRDERDHLQREVEEAKHEA